MVQSTAAPTICTFDQAGAPMRSGAGRRVCSGISIVEFVGCLAALGGGVVLGSLYLGVDVKAMAVDLLEKADINVPVTLASEDAESSAPESGVADTTDADQDSTVTIGAETALSANEDSDAADDDSVEDSDPVAEAPQPLSEEEKLAATKLCWKSLSQAIRQEAANRTKSITDASNWQLFDYLLHRKKGHAKAVENLEAIELRGVDQRLKAHVQQVLAWQRSGAELFERAAHLLTDAPAGKLSGPFAQSWQSASTQHRMEEKLLLDKHVAIASYLEHTQKGSDASSLD